MVLIDVQIALGANRQIDQGMARDLIEHMVEKAHASMDVRLAGAVEERFNRDFSLFRLARDAGAAHGSSLI
jgi:hypothetical protein